MAVMHMCIKLWVVEDTRYEHIHLKGGGHRFADCAENPVYLKGGGHRVADRAKNADQKDTLAQ